jgi:hypothetical protein
MKKQFDFPIEPGQEEIWAKDFRYSFPDPEDCSVLTFPASHVRMGRIITSSTEVEVMVRLKFPSVRTTILPV